MPLIYDIKQWHKMCWTTSSVEKCVCKLVCVAQLWYTALFDVAYHVDHRDGVDHQNGVDHHVYWHESMSQKFPDNYIIIYIL